MEHKTIILIFIVVVIIILSGGIGTLVYFLLAGKGTPVCNCPPNTFCQEGVCLTCPTCGDINQICPDPPIEGCSPCINCDENTLCPDCT